MTLEDRCQIFNRVWWAIYGEKPMDSGTFQAPMSKEDKEGGLAETITVLTETIERLKRERIERESKGGN